MNGLLFGTGGVPHSSKLRATISGIERIYELGLGCMEVEFVQGVNMNEATARVVGEKARSTGIRLSAHAPYFINFNAHEAEKRRASQKRLIQTLYIAGICGAKSVVFHPAFYLGDPPEETYERVKESLRETLAQLKEESNGVYLRPETTGKTTQFGTIDELIRLSQELPGVLPCIDLAHWHARTGTYNTYDELARTLDLLGEQLGRAFLDNVHIHFSGISYGRGGELKHLNLRESDLNYKELLRALKDYAVKGLIICESPDLEEDALLLKESYEAL